ncbi:probable aspartyl protease At4g16563 [Neltuma alba]|uniref:probable aspartyl protease At4g16563 n=1 Tax=Neltuma alba TaxID=207710 RepID=UPI0010A459B9|nr:probable aspartyl protease At4g16563 [Prosopis alba]
MASPPILHLLCLFSLISFTSSFASITLPISPLHAKHPSSDPFQTLKVVASASLTRAHHLKHYKSNSSSSIIKTPDYPKTYGGYSVDLRFGTPPQTFPFVLDTGSSLVWFPCSSRYLCSRCSFPNIDASKLPKFIPKNSSSAKFVGCRNPKCGWIFGPDLQSRCQQCEPGARNCSQICPTYIIQYGSGSTAGLLLLESLDLPGKIVPDFVVGCSIMSIRQPAGIAGFGRGPESLPSQLGLKRFSYCLISHRFDDSTESSDLILQSESSGGTKTDGLSYTPFQKNAAASNPAFHEYYYLTIRKIIIGGKVVKIPSKRYEPDSDGNGGTIVDSGSTFTFMERPIFDMVSQEFEKQMANYTRAKEVETRSGLSPCFDFSGLNSISFPQFTIKFRGGANMTLPVENYFSLVGESQVACLTILSDNGTIPAVAGGPGVILGNYQQQNFYVEYDLENERFGFGPRSCKK